jgi:hypothetical protein
MLPQRVLGRAMPLQRPPGQATPPQRSPGRAIAARRAVCLRNPRGCKPSGPLLFEADDQQAMHRLTAGSFLLWVHLLGRGRVLLVFLPPAVPVPGGTRGCLLTPSFRLLALPLSRSGGLWLPCRPPCPVCPLWFRAGPPFGLSVWAFARLPSGFWLVLALARRGSVR